ncbi:carboxymuconolactone decarboxylase family protein [Erwinia sp. BNK-24-b]|uniref:carboxymuconolactone decarboxylase family protein n=1 Tax=Erwinia TaxID=551 RepID=UPI001FEDE9EE|nr:carboxymuconolactone decarboxylase family protein [Erwinia phyllosphaerae]MBV4365232.1 carboxymuconolactone decarboxylase family protein [Erwinia phyllosphaerae]
MSQLRLPYTSLSGEAYAGLASTKKALEKSTLGKELIEFVYLRISQINGCAFCLEMHAKSLRTAGVDNAKIDALSGWKVSSRFNDKERAALDWTEALVNVSETFGKDSYFNPLKAHFSDTEISDLTFAISLMSAFNRLAIGMRQ